MTTAQSSSVAPLPPFFWVLGFVGAVVALLVVSPHVMTLQNQISTISALPPPPNPPHHGTAVTTQLSNRNLQSQNSLSRVEDLSHVIPQIPPDFWERTIRKANHGIATKASVCPSEGRVVLNFPFACASGFVIAIAALSGEFSLTPEHLREYSSVFALILSHGSTLVPLPTEIGLLQNLEILLLSAYVYGTLPEELFTLTKLTVLAINNDHGLTGTIPDSISQLSRLTLLNFAHQQIHGHIPTAMCALTHLESIDWGYGTLQGPIPPCFGSLTNLGMFVAYSNEIMGSIPSQIGLLTKLTELNCDSNALSGSIPSQVGTLSKLQYLYFTSNQLVGTIPSEIGKLSHLAFLHLGNNSLVGTLPTELTRMSLLQRVRVDSNRLSGSFPALSNSFMEVWCNDSGLSDVFCARSCTRCSQLEVELQRCGPTGEGQRCINGLVFLPCFFGVMMAMAIALYAFKSPNLPRKRFLVVVFLASLGVVDFATDVIFAVQTSLEQVQIASFVLLGCTVFGNIVATVLLLTTTATEIGVDGLHVSPALHRLVFQTGWFLPYALLLCATNSRLLDFIMQHQLGVNNLRRTNVRVVVGMLTVSLEDVPQLIIQLYAFVVGNEKTLAVLISLVISFLSILIETVSAVFSRVLANDGFVVVTQASSTREQPSSVVELVSVDKACSQSTETVNLNSS